MVKETSKKLLLPQENVIFSSSSKQVYVQNGYFGTPRKQVCFRCFEDFGFVLKSFLFSENYKFSDY